MTNLACFASSSKQSRGRIFAELDGGGGRNAFARDRDRVIHSSAFRRLKRKTQVFTDRKGDHHRTRLTHTLEVAQIARSIARALHVNEDLAEAIALAHDLGHPPFAHAGEDALAKCMREYDGFEHNDQTLRILTLLERRYPRWDGLNLSWETLEGLAKHNGRITNSDKINSGLREIQKRIDLRLDTNASLEAQVAGFADDIAYMAHDVEDGLRAELITIEDLKKLGFTGFVLDRIECDYGNLEERIRTATLIREMIGAMIGDTLGATSAQIGELSPQSPDDVRNAEGELVCFSNDMAANIKELRAFLMENVYKRKKVIQPAHKGQQVIADLFDSLMSGKMKLPSDWDYWLGYFDKPRVIADYIAGMTDTYASDLINK